MKHTISLLYFVAAMFTASHAPSLAAPSCALPEIKVSGEKGLELGEQFSNYVQGAMAAETQELFAELLIQKYAQKSTNADGLVEAVFYHLNAKFTEVANKHLDLLKLTSASKAIFQGEYAAVGDMAIDEGVGKAAEYFLSNIGATSNGTLVGALINSVKIVKESYDTLEHEDCLTNIDLAYYSTMDDPKLRWGKDASTLPDGAVQHYTQNYLFGGGKDLQNGDRALNRRHLQCYINASLPESERINVSELRADAEDPSILGWFDRVFAITSDTLSSAADRASDDKRLRLPVTVMLRDFNARRDLEDAAKEVTRLRADPEFRRLVATADAMQVAQKAEQWLCDNLQKFASVGKWQPTAIAAQPAWIANQPLPLPEALSFEVDENGDIRTQIDDKAGGGLYIYNGKMTDGILSASFQGEGLNGESGIMEPIFEVQVRGELVEGKLAGEFDGLINRCIVEDDCGMVPFVGKWTAERLE